MDSISAQHLTLYLSPSLPYFHYFGRLPSNSFARIFLVELDVCIIPNLLLQCAKVDSNNNDN